MDNQITNNHPKIVLSWPFDLVKPTNFEFHEGFPNCCEEHKTEFKKVLEFRSSLENYLNNHLPFVKEDGIETAELLQNLPLRILKSVCYTQHMISILIDSDQWCEGISKYIKEVADSLGDRLFGLEYYAEAVIYFVDNNSTIPFNKRNEVLKILYDQKDKPSSNQIVKDLNLLCATYEKWLRYFPFELSFFSDLKEELFSSKPIFKKTNYQGEDTLEIATHPELIEFLNQKTKYILSQVDTVKLVKEEQITDIEKTKLDLISQEHQHKQRVLLDTFRKGEKKYTNAISDWLENEKHYFSNITPIVSQPKSPKVLLPYFQLKDGATRYQNTNKLADKLISKNLIKKECRANFINAFIGFKPKEKVNWIGAFGDLKAFIKHCHLEIGFQDNINQWVIASEVFTINSVNFTSTQIKDTKFTRNDISINKWVKLIL